MPTGPLGGPRPFAQEQCKVILVVVVNHGGEGSPDDAHFLEDIVADAARYELQEDRRSIMSYGDGEISIAAIPFMSITPSSLAETEDQIRSAVNSKMYSTSVQIRVDAGDAQRIVEEYM